MGILPLQFNAGETAETYGLTGSETFTIDVPAELKVGMQTQVHTSSGKDFAVTMRLDTEPEISYFKNGGILHYVLRKLLTN
jgi:aconitate hydratase